LILSCVTQYYLIARILYPYKLAVMGLVADKKRIMLEKLHHCTRSVFCLVLIGSIVVLSTSMVHAAQSDRDLYFISLEKRLVTDGFNAAKIDALFQRPDITFQTRNVSLFFILRKGKMDHSHYTDTKSIQKAKNYMHKHQTDLDRIETTAGVQKTVVTAIILVETRLGTTVGKSSVFNSLSSIAALDNPTARDKVWKSLDDNADLTRQTFDKKAKQKSSWAYRELKAFLKYTAKENIDPLTIKGSFAGAMGIPQFMPTNIEPYGKDGSGDGTIDLFNHADAQASVANFLKKHGWKPGSDRKKQKKVIHHYNHSDDYVDSILKISDLLK
jgi:membrane-bound lytic murein transglycosylase B